MALLRDATQEELSEFLYYGKMKIVTHCRGLVDVLIILGKNGPIINLLVIRPTNEENGDSSLSSPEDMVTQIQDTLGERGLYAPINIEREWEDG